MACLPWLAYRPMALACLQAFASRCCSLRPPGSQQQSVWHPPRSLGLLTSPLPLQALPWPAPSPLLACLQAHSLCKLLLFFKASRFATVIRLAPSPLPWPAYKPTAFAGPPLACLLGLLTSLRLCLQAYALACCLQAHGLCKPSLGLLTSPQPLQAVVVL